MSDRHSHGSEELQGRNLIIATILNFVITIAEIVGGILSNSLALLSDALHNFSDGLAVFIAYIANRISRKESTPQKTFGYKRVEILAALLNAVVLVVISIYLFIESYRRLINPQEIKGMIMIVVASIGLIANIVAVFLLHPHSKHNLNIKAAYLHLLGDTLSSFAVIAGGVLIYFFEIYWLDPIITFLIGLYILKETFQILKETIDILMQSTPAGIDPEKIKYDIESIEHVMNIHHLHIWNLNDKQIHFECHIDLDKDVKLSDTQETKLSIEKLLHDKYGISHLTIQFEYDLCSDKEMIHQQH